MEATLYANLNRQTLGEKLDGSAFSWPQLVAGDTASLRLRFSKRIEGRNQLVSMDIADVYAAVSVIDQRPRTGTYRLKIGPLEDPGVVGTNLTTALAAAATASEWQTALNALTLCAGEGDYGPATVTADNGSYIVVFENLATAAVIVLAENELAPSTLLRVIPVDRDGTLEHDCRLIQAPASMTSSYSIEAGSAPSVVRHRSGSSEDGAAINEVQILIIPPDFDGAAEFERNGLRSEPFSKFTKPARFAEILEPLADEDGTWSVTDILPNELWIEFQGSMAATPQDLLTTHVVRAPQGDCAFSLDLNQPAIFALLREKDSVDAYVHIVVLYEDPDTEEMRRWSYLAKVKLVRPVVWNGLDVNEAIAFLKKPGDSHLPVADGQIITGSQHYTRAFPTTLELSATSFTVTHNLGEDFGHIVVATDTSPGVRLVEGTDYAITIVNDDQFTIQLLAGGYFAGTIVEEVEGTWQFVRTGDDNVDCLNHLAVAFSSIGPKSAFADHDHFISDINGLQAFLTDIFGRIVALEALSGLGIPFQSVDNTTGPLTRSLGIVWRVPRARTLPPRPASLLEWRVTAEDLGAQPGRPIRLQPAVHDAVVTPLPATLPKPAASKGSVFSVGTARPELGGLKAGDFVASSGLELYRVVNRPGTSSYYPAAFELTLFETAINALEFPVKSTLQLLCGIELMMLALQAKARERRSAFQWTLILEAGVPTADASPGTPGANLAAAFANPITLLEQRLILTEIPIAARFGCKIVRAGDGSMTARWIYNGRDGELETAPASVPFALRGRLAWGDTENAPSDPRAIVAARGLDVGLDGQPDPTLGKLTIS